MIYDAGKKWNFAREKGKYGKKKPTRSLQTSNSEEIGKMVI